VSGGAGVDERLRRRLRIQRLIELARRIADAADPLGIEARERLLGTSGLSREGIELALTRHMEIDPSEAELEALLDSSGGGGGAGLDGERLTTRCHVVIAANVCTSALRAIAVALSVSPSVIVRPSSRDPVLAEMLVRELDRDDAFREASGSISLDREVHAVAGEELHVYGADRTVEALRAAAAPGVVVRGHGTGFGVAVIGEDIDLGPAARDLTRDVLPFDQRGCLSPRIALVEGSAARASAFYDALAEQLDRASITRGPLDEGVRAELAMYRASIEAIGEWREGISYAVGFDPAPRSLPLPPAARVVHIAPASAQTASALLFPWAPFIAAIGAIGDGALLRAVLAMAPDARRSRLGEMQRPPLDGPVDRRGASKRLPLQP